MGDTVPRMNGLLFKTSQGQERSEIDDITIGSSLNIQALLIRPKPIRRNRGCDSITSENPFYLECRFKIHLGPWQIRSDVTLPEHDSRLRLAAILVDHFKARIDDRIGSNGMESFPTVK